MGLWPAKTSKHTNKSGFVIKQSASRNIAVLYIFTTNTHTNNDKIY